MMRDAKPNGNYKCKECTSKKEPATRKKTRIEIFIYRKMQKFALLGESASLSRLFINVLIIALIANDMLLLVFG